MAKVSKKLSERTHAKKRLKSSYGLVFSKKLRRELVQMVQSGITTPIGRTSLRNSHHQAVIGECTVTFVYDCVRHEIVTFLPPEEKVKV
jgi:uncharacterized membrane protein